MREKMKAVRAGFETGATWHGLGYVSAGVSAFLFVLYLCGL